MTLLGEDIEAVQELVKAMYPALHGKPHHIAFAALHAYLSEVARVMGLSEDELVDRIRRAYRAPKDNPCS